MRCSRSKKVQFQLPCLTLSCQHNKVWVM
uniref:Uncharacterized protein n=1 Tax=Rhizophora mucronata TaxID=61149 RepID=A0A2P2QAU4_RHIMU